MSDSRFPGMTDEQLERLLRGLPRREPPPGLRARVLAARPRRRSLLQPRFAFAALVLLVALDIGVLRWQGSGMTTPSSLPPSLVAQDDDLLLLAQEAGGGLWSRTLTVRPAPAQNYLQLRDQLLRTMERG